MRTRRPEDERGAGDTGQAQRYGSGAGLGGIGGEQPGQVFVDARLDPLAEVVDLVAGRRGGFRPAFGEGQPADEDVAPNSSRAGSASLGCSNPASSQRR
jgi:hypothetical protein